MPGRRSLRVIGPCFVEWVATCSRRSPLSTAGAPSNQECDQQPLATNEQGVSYPSQVTESRWSLVACAMAGETHLPLHLPARRHQHYARSMSVDMHAGSDATFFRVVDEPLFDCGRTLVRSLAQSVPSLKTRCRRGPLTELDVTLSSACCRRRVAVAYLKGGLKTFSGSIPRSRPRLHDEFNLSPLPAAAAVPPQPCVINYLLSPPSARTWTLTDENLPARYLRAAECCPIYQETTRGFRRCTLLPSL